MRLAPGLVRIPEVSFISWDRFPNRRLPDEPIPDLAPDLAVEVLSPSNTREEMRRKLHDYFTAGSRLVWFVDPAARTVTVYTSPDQSMVLRPDQTLDGGPVLPGFSLPLSQLFAELDPQ
jgi:Uma2 family endonuclease